MNKLNKWVIGIYISLYIVISIVSTMHSVSFFGMTNDAWMARSLAAAFELGQLAAMAGLMTLEKSNKKLIVGLMVTLTAMQIMANMFFSYSHVSDARAWFELFGLQGTDPITAKRILAAVSGGLLPLIALGFIKSLVDYLKPDDATEAVVAQNTNDTKQAIIVPEVIVPIVVPTSVTPVEFKQEEDKKVYEPSATVVQQSNPSLPAKDNVIAANTVAEVKFKKILPLKDGTLPDIN